MGSKKQTQREIKFRAWIEGRMEEVETIGFIKPNEICPNEMGENPVMQYTGLKDKNGKEIYEGDIIHYYVKAERRYRGEQKVTYDERKIVSWGAWTDDEYGYKIYTWLLGSQYLMEENDYINPYWDAIEEKFEVIGNIHENPELLK